MLCSSSRVCLCIGVYIVSTTAKREEKGEKDESSDEE